jgi:glycosyltransferase involved in cell wall biosynthesis
MDKEIRVLHVLNSAHGGSAISTFEIINILKSYGISSSIVCFNNADNELQKHISSLVDGRILFIPLYWMNKRVRASLWKRPLIEMKAVWDTWFGYKYQACIQDLILKNGINIIHTSTSLNPEGAILAKKLSIPHIWHIRELIGDDKDFRFHNYNRWSKFFDSHSDRIVANSRSTFNCAKRYINPERISIIPNGVDISNFVRKHHSPKKRIVIGMVGNVTSRLKNHQLFLELANCSKNLNVEFHIFGKIPSDSGDQYFASLQSYIVSNNLSNISFKGYFKKTSKIMDGMDILFHPNPNESFGRIFIEAMAAGVPVIAISGGGADDIISNNSNGFLVKSVFEAHEIVSKLITDDQLRERISIEGRKTVESKYTDKILGKALFDMYNEVVR